MRSRILVSAGVLAFVLALLALTPVSHPIQAQSSQPIVCDSTLITLDYLAEHDYGFHSSMDVSKFEKGQFKPLFDTMMASMAGGKMQGTAEAMMAATPAAMMSGTADAMMAATPAAMMEGTQGAAMAMTELKPGNVSGEDPSCAELRTEVEAYLGKALSQGMMKK